MSRMDIDDLVASFSGQHIGQEAIDLAALQVCAWIELLPAAPYQSLMLTHLFSLQTQLAQTLMQFNHTQSGFPSPIQTQGNFNFVQSPSAVQVGYQASGPNTTPTSTPSNLYWPSGRSRSTSRARNNSVSSSARFGEPSSSSSWSEDMQDMAEVEEEMVAEDEEAEELAWFYQQQQQRQLQKQQQPQYGAQYRMDAPPHGSNLYAATNYTTSPVSPVFPPQSTSHYHSPPRSRVPYSPTSPIPNDRSATSAFILAQQYASIDPGQQRRGRWESTAT